MRIVGTALIALILIGLPGCQGRPTFGPLACPDALLEGTLVEDAGALAVEELHGLIYPVVWPDGISVSPVDGQLAVIGFFGQLIAREGDFVSMGGGYAPGDVFFTACGDIRVTPRGS